MMDGEKLRQLRKAHRMTLEDVARHLGVSRATVLRYETGMITNIPSDKIEIMARLFNVSPAYLLGWEENADRVNDLPSSEMIKKIIMKMPPADYQMVWEAIDRNYKRLKEKGEIE